MKPIRFYLLKISLFVKLIVVYVQAIKEDDNE